MENIENTDPSRTEEGNRVTEGSDQDQQQNSQVPSTDDIHPIENTDAIIGDVHPTERSDTFQEEMNAETENRSDSSEIAGESL